MQCIADYEIESDMSVVSDDIRLKLGNPSGRFQARIKNIVRKDYSTPFLLSLQIIIEAPDLQAATKIAQDSLVECLNILAFVTGASIRLHRTKQIIDCGPSSGMRDCRIWAESVGHKDPIPFLDDNIVRSMECLLQFDAPPAIRRALRWYRIGVYESAPEDQFQFFWFALEILAEYQKNTEKVPDRCPRCKGPLYCETCTTHPTHRPYAKQAIHSLIRAVAGNCDDATIDALDKTRNALMHGATLKEIEESLPESEDHIADVLGRIVFMALIHQFPKEYFDGTIKFGSPSTYLHQTLGGVAHIQTVVPAREDGELDLEKFTGLKVSMVTDGPPQSGRPGYLEMSPAQHRRLGAISRSKGAQQELCKRIYGRVRIGDGRVVAKVYATEMKEIRVSLESGQVGEWLDLFREIMAESSNTN